MANTAILYAKIWHNIYYLRRKYKEHIEAIMYIKNAPMLCFGISRAYFCLDETNKGRQ